MEKEGNFGAHGNEGSMEWDRDRKIEVMRRNIFQRLIENFGGRFIKVNLRVKT